MSAASGLSDVPLGGKAPADTLEWQSFPTSAASTAIPVATAVNAAAPGDASAAANGSASAEAAALSNSLVNLEVAPEIASPLACFTPTFAKFVFGNVTTAQVGARLSAALWPLQRVWFPQLLDKKPDFYGPFWIAATLVFLIGVGSNLASWLSFKPGDAVSLWHYDFTLVTFALVAVYSFTFALPLAVWLALSYLGITNLPLVYLVCIYGYSLTVFLPTAVSLMPAVLPPLRICVAPLLELTHSTHDCFRASCVTSSLSTAAFVRCTEHRIAVDGCYGCGRAVKHIRPQKRFPRRTER